MKKIIKDLINNRKITLFFVFALIAAGVLAFIGTPKQESPDFSIPYAMITAVFPGASQSDVDEYVTKPIDEAVHSIDGYDSSFAYSSNSLSLIILELKFSADRDESLRQLEDAMAALQKELPEECQAINVNTDITNTAGILLSLSSQTLTNSQILDEAQFIKEELGEIDGFSHFEIIGSMDQVLSVKIKEDAMKAAGLTFSEVLSLVQSGSLDLPIGKVEESQSLLTVDYTGGYDSIDDVSNLEIGYSQEAGTLLRLKDMADISYETADSSTYYTHNGDSAVIIAGYFEDDINTLPLKDEIDDKLKDLDSDLPSDLETSLIVSQPDEIDGSLIDFTKNLIIAVILVILVVLFGMGFRNAVVVSVSLPLSVLMSFGAMYLFGIKIHQISIAALIVSLGMLVDNSIVVSDSIQGYLDEGMKRKSACVLGVKSVAYPVFTSTLTTIAAFLPFMFLNSIAGDYIKSLPQIVCIALVASYLSAMFVIPVLGYIFFKRRSAKSKKHTPTRFKKLLKASMKRRVVVICTVAVMLGLSVLMVLNLDVIFFPASDKDILYIDITNNISNDVESTSVIVSEITDMLSDESGVLEYTASAGGGLPRFNEIMYIYTKTPDIGQIMMRIDLDKAGYDTNEEYKDALQEKLDNLGLAAKTTVKELMYAFPMDEDLKIRIVGDDLAQIKEDEAKIYDLLKDTQGLININKSNTEYVDEYSMQILSENAVKSGIIPAQAQNEISIAMLGRTASSVKYEGYDADVIVRGPYKTATDLKNIPLKNALGEYITAGSIMELEKTNTLSTIPRFDGDYAMAVTADFDLDYNKKDTLRDVRDAVDELNLEDVKIIYEGEDELIKENFGQVGILGLVALAVVFIILMIQFKSFSMPLLIFVTIPLSAIGSVAGLYITGQPISFTALLGIVSLLGIVVNNAIILIDYIKHEQEKEITIKKACINASLRRLRPILLSTITTVIGLIPLAISNSDLFKPMAIALMSGLLVSTLLTLVVLPVLVSIVKNNKQTGQTDSTELSA